MTARSAAAIEAAWARFQTLLAELVGELALLRADLSAGAPVMPRGPVARRMVAACRPHARGGRFITAMAAVAGSVAEELLGALRRSAHRPRLDQQRRRHRPAPDAGNVVRGRRLRRSAPRRRRPAARRPLHGRRVVAGPRHRHLGLARAQLLARHRRQRHRAGDDRAARADAAATIVANAVDVDDARIVRAPANAVRDDSDLGDRLVVRAVPPLPAALVDDGAGARRRRGARPDRRRAHHRRRALAARPLARRRRGRRRRIASQRRAATGAPSRFAPQRAVAAADRRKDSHALSRQRRRPRGRRPQARLRGRGRLARQRPAPGAAAAPRQPRRGAAGTRTPAATSRTSSR